MSLCGERVRSSGVEHISLFESLLHLGVFVSLAALVGVAAVAAVERLAGASNPLVKPVHVAIAAGLLVLFIAADVLHDLIA